MSMTLEQIEEKLAGMNLNLGMLVREDIDEWHNEESFKDYELFGSDKDLEVTKV